MSRPEPSEAGDWVASESESESEPDLTCSVAELYREEVADEAGADADEAGLAGGGDPLWCESDWPGSVGARAYERESDAFELGVFVAGVAVTVAAIWLANRFEEAMKRAVKEE